MSTNGEAPQFFSSGSDFVNKEELAQSKKQFCITDVTDTDTVYGAKWYVQIFVAGTDELQTMTFSHGDATKSKREQDFLQLAANPQYLPLHACTLSTYSFQGKTGYRIIARNGGGACPCTPGEKVDGDPFLPDFDEIEKPAPAPAPQVKPATTIENSPASPKQYATIGKLSALLSRDVDMPETYGQAATIIVQLEQDYKAMTAQLQRPAKVTAGVPMR